jgi:putative transposase
MRQVSRRLGAPHLDLMVVIDKQFLETPFYGVQQMIWHLRNEGYIVNYKRIRRLMRLMRLMPIYQKPDIRCPATHACMCEKGQARERA